MWKFLSNFTDPENTTVPGVGFGDSFKALPNLFAGTLVLVQTSFFTSPTTSYIRFKRLQPVRTIQPFLLNCQAHSTHSTSSDLTHKMQSAYHYLAHRLSALHRATSSTHKCSWKSSFQSSLALSWKSVNRLQIVTKNLLSPIWWLFQPKLKQCISRIVIVLLPQQQTDGNSINHRNEIDGKRDIQRSSCATSRQLLPLVLELNRVTQLA